MLSAHVRGVPSIPWWALASISIVCCGSKEGDETSSGGAGAMEFSPAGIELHPPPIEMPGLTMIAYTMLDGHQGLELYVALRNDSETPACGAAISVDLYDDNEQSLASSVTGVIGGSPYQVVDLPDTYSGCVPPGQVAMAALTDWPDDVFVDAVGHLAYRCPYFELAVTPAGEFHVSNAERESTALGDVYRGTLTNQLEITVYSPEVVIFPLAESGRPLGMLSVQGTMTLPPADSWVFESAPTDVRGDDFRIFSFAATESSNE